MSICSLHNEVQQFSSLPPFFSSSFHSPACFPSLHSYSESPFTSHHRSPTHCSFLSLYSCLRPVRCHHYLSPTSLYRCHSAFTPLSITFSSLPTDWSLPSVAGFHSSSLSSVCRCATHYSVPLFLLLILPDWFLLCPLLFITHCISPTLALLSFLSYSCFSHSFPSLKCFIIILFLTTDFFSSCKSLPLWSRYTPSHFHLFLYFCSFFHFYDFQAHLPSLASTLHVPSCFCSYKNLLTTPFFLLINTVSCCPCFLLPGPPVSPAPSFHFQCLCSQEACWERSGRLTSHAVWFSLSSDNSMESHEGLGWWE